MASNGSIHSLQVLADSRVVSLQIKSPSAVVSSPLLFPGLSVTTTIKQLKEKIRESLPLVRPPDHAQRLIHRGHALIRESDTLLNVLGEDAVNSNEQQTMHLVIRELDAPSNPTATPTTRTPRESSASPAVQPVIPPRVAAFNTNTTPTFVRRIPLSQPQTSGTTSPHAPSPAPGQTTTTAPFGQTHPHLEDWISHVHREARNLQQSHRVRATIGMRSMGESPQDAGHHNHARPNPTMGRFYRETVGPNGQTYRVETIVQTSTSPLPRLQNTAVPSSLTVPSSAAGLSPADVQNLLRSADMAQATAAMTSAMRRSVSNPQLYTRFQAGLSNPSTGMTSSTPTPAVDSRVGSNNNESGDQARSMSGGAFTGTTSATDTASTPATTRPQAVDVYILSSPEGPRAILVNNHTSETYYTPRLRTQTSHSRLRNFAGVASQAVSEASTTPPPHALPQQPSPPLQTQPQHHQQHHHQHHQPQQQPADRIAQQEPHQPEGVLNPHNRHAAGLPPLLAQYWPYIWLVFRLGVFIWFFTSPNSTWARWASVIGLAVFIFFASTGVLNNTIALAWRPVTQYINGRLPGVQRHRHRQPAAAAAAEVAAHVTSPDTTTIDPARMAARLRTERAEHDANWVLAQMRRIERAGLLFLASLAPGVAEGHIAHVEAEARAERERIEAVAAEAARLAEESASSNIDTTTAQHQDERREKEEGEGGQQELEEDDEDEEEEDDVINEETRLLIAV